MVFSPHICRAKLLALALLSLGASGWSAAYTFKDVVVEGGGYVPAFVYHPNSSGLLYCRTDMGGAYRWDPTNSVWIPLTDFITIDNEDSLGMLALALDPNDATRLYLETGKYTQTSWAQEGNLLVSTNQGNSFTIVPLPFWVGGNENGRGLGERLAVDPNLGSILFAGATTDSAGNGGLWKSTSYGSAGSWVKTSFPVNNVSFIMFDPTGTTGSATQTLYVGTGSPTSGNSGLYRSTDGGSTWAVVPNQPSGLIASRGVISGTNAYFTFGNNIGPNGNTTGAVYRLATATNTWTNISPVNGPTYGYCGISIDKNNAQHLIVSTINNWNPRDIVWQTSNASAATPTWVDMVSTSTLNNTEAPWSASRQIHWVSCVAMNPYNSNEVWFGTGYGAFHSTNFGAAAPCTWGFNDHGLEETVPLQLIAPPSGGASLLSAMGDQGGFRHTTLDTSPAAGFYSDSVGSTMSIDYAEAAPLTMVKTHYSTNVGSISTDGGVTWAFFGAMPAGASTANGGGTRSIAISADASHIVWCPPGASSIANYSANSGGSWTASTGITSNPNGIQFNPVADRKTANKFYAYDCTGPTFYVSTNGGASFTSSTPAGITALAGWQAWESTINTVFGIDGDVWICQGPNGLYHSTNSGASFSLVSSAGASYLVGFGKAPAGKTYPTIFLWGRPGGTLGIYRSDDGGTTWTLINDASHQYGGLHFMCGDQNIYGRIYFSAEGRGIKYGDIPVAGTPTFTVTPSRTPTSSSTATATATRTATPSQTSLASTSTFTSTPSPTGTMSRTATPSPTSTATPTQTSLASTSTSTGTASRTATPSATGTRTATPSNSATASSTSTISDTPTATPTFTNPPTGSSPTDTPSISPTSSATPSRTGTGTPSPSATAALSTATSTATGISTGTQTVTRTASQSPTTSASDTPGPAPTESSTITPGPSSTSTSTPLASSPTSSRTPTGTATPSPSATPSFTSLSTGSPTPTGSASPSGTLSSTASPSATATFSGTATPSSSATATFSFTATASQTATPTASSTATRSASPTTQATPTPSASAAASLGGLRLLKVLPVPNPQHGPLLSLYVDVQGRADSIKVRLYSQALNEVASFTTTGGSGWVQVQGKVPSLPAGTYFVVVRGASGGQASTAKTVTLLWLP